MMKFGNSISLRARNFRFNSKNISSGKNLSRFSKLGDLLCFFALLLKTTIRLCWNGNSNRLWFPTC